MKLPKNPVNKLTRRGRRSLVLGFLSLMVAIAPVTAANEILFFLGPFGRSVKVSSLEVFAKNGTIDGNLRQYLRNTTPAQQAEFREALTKSAPLSPVLLSRFFNTEMGESILNRMGGLVTIQGGSNGKFALRSALIKGALAPGGLTLLSFLQNLPTNMQVDVQQALLLARQIELVLKATEYFTAEVAHLSTIEAERAGAIDFSPLPDLRQPGPYAVEEKRWILTDKSRNRQFYALIFQPKSFGAGKIPVIVFSHGLASRPEDFARQAEYWASYGYVVVMPQHPGSDTIQVQNLLAGLSREVFDRSEFIDRPLDLRYTIDELERRNAAEYGGRLDLNNVGVGGHSFGGYAALAVAGARIDFDYLQSECSREFGYVNISRLLQCQALNLPRKDYDFRDPRVKAVFAANPVNSSIFGPKGLAEIKIPVILAAGTYDPATPAIFEQVRSFPWLSSEDKYLLMIEGQAHVDFSVLDAGLTQTIESAIDLTLPSPYLIDTYANALSLAFFQIHLRDDRQFRPLLQAAYTAYLSEGQQFKCFLITRASSAGLDRSIAEFIRRYVPNLDIPSSR
ncbi:alpha/beta hydrolase [Pannus brasiliensis CCIBt3594]|uniref:Alpha/beta hydrolase n=1 Tax=Pannus brasiliensis CCIBt3594 TaxID=1427578 RepID=A0AAW9QMC2_9CHRO